MALIVWFVFLRPTHRRRYREAIAELPRWDLRAEPKLRAGARARRRSKWTRVGPNRSMTRPPTGWGVPVEQVPRLVALDPGEQPLEADVRRVFRVVVDPQRRAVGDQDVGAGSLRASFTPLFCV